MRETNANPVKLSPDANKYWDDQAEEDLLMWQKFAQKSVWKGHDLKLMFRFFTT